MMGSFIISKEECFKVSVEVYYLRYMRSIWMEILYQFFITPLQKPCLAGEVARCRRSCGNQEVGYSHIFWYMVYFRIRHYKEH